MEQIVSNFVPFFVDGYVDTLLPLDIFKNLENEINKIKLNNFQSNGKINQELAGAIQHEYQLNISSNLQKYVDIIVKQYVDNTTHFEPNYVSSPITSLWVNFQKKYEYNPIHNHNDNLSFVIWLKIPYFLHEELDLPHITNSEDARKLATQFVLTYPNPYKKNIIAHHSCRIDEKSVRRLVLFNSSVYHSVYPFYTSDEYRISVAGNIKLIYD